MKLVSVHLRNFMPYRGEHSVAFPVNGARNVSIIYGDNMRGKTSMLSAIRWALYAKVADRHLNTIPSIHLINKDAVLERDFFVSVKVRFVHDEREYELIRTMKPKELIDTPREDDHLAIEPVMRREGIPIPGHQIEEEINRILPESISRFSLFDGELLQEYEQLVAEASESSDRIKDAIEKALGVPTLINGRAHISELLHRAQRQFQREGQKDNQHAKLIQQTLEELDESTRERNRLKELLDGAVTERDVLDDFLKKLERAESIKGRLEENQRQQANAQTALERALVRRAQLAPQAWAAIVSAAMDARRRVLEADLARSQGALEEAVEARMEHRHRLASLHSGSCTICSQPLSDSARGELSRRTQSANTVSDFSAFTTQISSLARQLEKLRAVHGTGVATELVQVEREFDRLTIEINRLGQREGALLAEIPGVDIAELGRKRERRDSLQREIGRVDGLYVAQQAKCAAAQKKYDVLIKAAASGQQASSQLIARKVTMLSALSEVFERSIDKLRHKLRERVQETASRTFRLLTTEKQYRGLVINDRYGLEIRDHLDRPVSVRSAGAEQIVALSLIDGLSGASGNRGILVMDTPFGRLDLKHRAQVLEYLPSMAKQVVLLVHEGELSRDRDLHFVAERLAASYEIQRVSATQSQIVQR